MKFRKALGWATVGAAGIEFSDLLIGWGPSVAVFGLAGAAAYVIDKRREDRKKLRGIR